MRLWHTFASSLAGFVLISALIFADQPPDTNPAPTPAPTPAPEPPPKSQFFAGTVSDLGNDHITVSRTLFGQPMEKHTFVINDQTKSPRSLKIKSKVTVRYQTMPEGDIALEIQIRTQDKPPRPS